MADATGLNLVVLTFARDVVCHENTKRLVL